MTTTAPTELVVRMWTEPIELRAAQEGDGNTMFGHFAVYNRWTEINSWEGRFLERIASGAFDRTFAERGDQVRVLYEHGHDPMIGNKPLGVPKVMRSDKKGAYYEVDLFDVSYVRDLKPAIEAGQLGASFRFRVASEEWTEPAKASTANPSRWPERTITDLDLFEFGPVTFGAYAEASSGLRSMNDWFADKLLDDPLFVARLAERTSGRAASHLIDLAARGQGSTQHPEAAPRGQTEGSRTGTDPRVLATKIQALRLATPRKDRA
jgi:HK97 family phage prohead protease